MKLPALFLAILLPLTLQAMSQPKNYEVKSPDGNIVLKVEAGDKLNIHMAPGGGWAARIERR